MPTFEELTGDGSTFKGNVSIVSGNSNCIEGDINELKGNDNIIYGNVGCVSGNNNRIHNLIGADEGIGNVVGVLSQEEIRKTFRKPKPDLIGWFIECQKKVEQEREDMDFHEICSQKRTFTHTHSFIGGENDRKEIDNNTSESHPLDQKDL